MNQHPLGRDELDLLAYYLVRWKVLSAKPAPESKKYVEVVAERFLYDAPSRFGLGVSREGPEKSRKALLSAIADALWSDAFWTDLMPRVLAQGIPAAADRRAQSAPPGNDAPTSPSGQDLRAESIVQVFFNDHPDRHDDAPRDENDAIDIPLRYDAAARSPVPHPPETTEQSITAKLVDSVYHASWWVLALIAATILAMIALAAFLR